MEVIRAKFVSNAKFGIPVEDGTIFRAKSGSVEISIHRIVNCDGWFLNCKVLGYWDRELESDSLIAAINESKSMIYWMNNAFYGSRKACKKFIKKVSTEAKIVIEE